MTATPTPGDLSARLRLEVETALRVARNLEDGVERVMTAIAALSALPAAGGEVTVKHDGRGLIQSVAVNDKTVATNPEYVVATTPQPSAAEGAVDREELLKDYLADYEFLGDDAGYRPNERELLLIEDALRGWEALDEPRAIPAIAAVGAQGDRLRNAYLRDMEDTLRQLHAIVGMDSPDVDALIEKVRRLAAPAAGKGVDDAMVERALEAQAEYWGDEAKHVRCETCKGTGEDRAAGDWCGECGGQGMNFDGDESGAMRAALEAALTRQPVAGDGWRPIESAPRDGRTVILCHLSSEPFMGRWSERRAWWVDAADSLRDPTHWQPNIAAPAATPTDGGEGYDDGSGRVRDWRDPVKACQTIPASYCHKPDGGEGA